MVATLVCNIIIIVEVISMLLLNESSSAASHLQDQLHTHKWQKRKMPLIKMPAIWGDDELSIPQNHLQRFCSATKA